MSKINVGVLLGFWGPGIPLLPPPLKGAFGIPKLEKLEYCNTIKIVLYNFVIIFFKNRKKCKKNVFNV